MTLKQQREKRTEWFRHDRFGMFLHWGLYAIPARNRSEWYRSVAELSSEEYEYLTNEFNPTCYNPRKWARLAKEAGMQYAVLTAKHHDGFCLFDSKLTDFKASNTKAGRDLVREYVEAFRAEGLKVGLYYSLLDWHHPDYPAFGDANHPMRNFANPKDQHSDFNRYLDYMHGQIRELCSNYGKIDILWFDFSYDDMKGEKWQATKLVKMVRELQPDVIIDNRLEGDGSSYGTIASNSPSFYSGDFASPEMTIPPEGIIDEDGEPVPWEACVTLNNNWGYCFGDKLFKSPKQLIRKLVECVSKNGNMILNIAPNALGEIPPVSENTLTAIGQWMKKNYASIYGNGKAKFPKPEWGYYTQCKNKLYAHVFDNNIGPLPLPGLKGKIEKARLLSDGSEISIVDAWNTAEFSEYLYITFGHEEDWWTYPLPDDVDTVVELELKESTL